MTRRRLGWFGVGVFLVVCSYLAGAWAQPPRARQAQGTPPARPEAPDQVPAPAAPRGLPVLPTGGGDEKELPLPPDPNDPTPADATITPMEPEGEDDLPPPPELKLPDPSSIRPQSLTPIPDDPPPHEGSLFDLPIVVEPPDILVIQVLLALPGRPIEGEFLVRPDGTIHLGYYGILHVRGLALAQVKEKVVLRLRRFIRDEALGLWRKEEIDGGKYQWVTVPPQDVENIFVDVGTYNSTFYYIQGDVALAGRIPCTGHETIFDALVAAGGLVATANPRDITLVRPARGIQPSKTYKIDYEAITKRGDVRANLQVFPGDRIIVGRDPIAQATDQNNRRLAPFFTFMDSVKSYATALRSAKTVLKDLPLDPNERGAMVKDLVDLLWEVGHRADGAVLDEKTFKEAVSRHLNAVLESSPKEARDAKPEASKPSTP